MGSLLKQWVGQKQRIYHVTVMPCYDKKLEAAREDFADENSKERDVDCVITASKWLCIDVTCLKSGKF